MASTKSQIPMETEVPINRFTYKYLFITPTMPYSTKSRLIEEFSTNMNCGLFNFVK